MNIKSKIAGAVAVTALFAGLAIPASEAQDRGGWGLGGIHGGWGHRLGRGLGRGG